MKKRNDLTVTITAAIATTTITAVIIISNVLKGTRRIIISKCHIHLLMLIHVMYKKIVYIVQIVEQKLCKMLKINLIDLMCENIS